MARHQAAVRTAEGGIPGRERLSRVMDSLAAVRCDLTDVLDFAGLDPEVVERLAAADTQLDEAIGALKAVLYHQDHLSTTPRVEARSDGPSRPESP